VQSQHQKRVGNPNYNQPEVKYTELFERDGVEVKNQTMPFKIGFVTEPIMFCKKPETASSNIFVSVPVCLLERSAQVAKR